MPENYETQSRSRRKEILQVAFRLLSYSTVIVSFYLSLATVGFAIIGPYSTYVASSLALIVIVATMTYLYLMRLERKKKVLASLPQEEKGLFELIERDVHKILAEDQS